MIIRVYPRVCGGTTVIELARTSTHGLSPRVRGNHFVDSKNCTPCGSIPACAGEPGAAFAALREGRVYPRVCGGTVESLWSPDEVEGLSPRVRGNRMDKRSPSQYVRSIPACAGEPSIRLARLPSSEVYPRVCGGTEE